MPPVDTPEWVGRYRVVELVGSGAFATVWRAHDPQFGEDVAVKILAENWLDRTDIKTRFADEARMLRRADNDHVVRVYDIGQLDDGRPYFAMTYADRGNLEQRLTDVPLPVADALRYAAETARAVAYLHDVGVLHRDVKPSNILFQTTTTGERLMLADLGLAKELAQASGFTLAVGTPGYMAPEQTRLGFGLDERVDVYALGALTYQLLTGHAPAPADTAQTLLPLARQRVGLPADTDFVVLRALEHDRDHRWGRASDLARALTTLLEQADSST